MNTEYKEYKKGAKSFRGLKNASKKAKLSILAAATVAMAGSFIAASQFQAAYTNTQSTQSFVETGTVRLAFGDTTDPFSVAVNNLLPGQSQSVYFNVKNVGSIPYGKLEAKMNTNGELVDKPAPYREYQTVDNNKVVNKIGNGGSPAVVKLESCSIPWSGGVCNNGASVNYGPVSGTSDSPVFTIPQASNLKPNEMIYLKTTYSLPSTAGPEYEGKSATFDFTMTATQINGRVTTGQEGF